MNALEKLDQWVQAASGGRLGTGISIFAGIARWTWRGCSLALFLFAGAFLLAGAGAFIKALMDPAQIEFGDVLFALGLLLLFAALALAWRWEWLGGTVLLLLLGIPTLISYWQGIHDDELLVYFAWVMVLLMWLSWALHTLQNVNAKPGLRRLALVVAPWLIIAIGYCLSLMPGSKFNP
jgi:hypothetical protein